MLRNTVSCGRFGNALLTEGVKEMGRDAAHFLSVYLEPLKENPMRKPNLILLCLLLAMGLTACAQPPVKAGPNPDAQRSRAHGTQDELSSEVHK